MTDHHYPFNVLFIEDDQGYASILKRRLGQVTSPLFHVEHFDRLETGLSCLAGGKTDVILLDLSLPDSKGLDTLNKVHAQAPEVPVVVSTGLDDDVIGIQAVRQGAEDYLVKGRADIQMISRVLRYAIERHSLRMALKNLSLTDELTGLLNRRGFLTLGQQQIKMALRTQIGFLLFFMDLDNFKQINDVQGHQAGDEALKDFANVLRSVFRSSDIVARIGGDEFTALAMKPNEGSANVLLSRLQQNLERYQAYHPRPFRLSISTGIEVLDLRGEPSIDEMMANADNRMYLHKREKRKIEMEKNANDSG